MLYAFKSPVQVLSVPVGHPSQSNHQRRQKLWKSHLAQKQISTWLFLFTCGGELGHLTIQLYANETESGLQHVIQSAGNRFHICKKIDLAPPSGGACEEIDNMPAANGSTHYTDAMFREVKATCRREWKVLI